MLSHRGFLSAWVFLPHRTVHTPSELEEGLQDWPHLILTQRLVSSSWRGAPNSSLPGQPPFLSLSVSKHRFGTNSWRNFYGYRCKYGRLGPGGLLVILTCCPHGWLCLSVLPTPQCTRLRAGSCLSCSLIYPQSLEQHRAGAQEVEWTDAGMDQGMPGDSALTWIYFRWAVISPWLCPSNWYRVLCSTSA